MTPFALASAFLLALARPIPTAAQAYAVREIRSLPGSSLVIRGSTTVGVPWHCGSNSPVASAAVQGVAANDGGMQLAIRAVDIRVPVAELRCQGGRMERAMRHALKADTDTSAGVILGHFTPRGELPAAVGGTIDLVGTLRVAGVEQPVVLHAAVTRAETGELLVHSEVPLTLGMFSITPPSVLFGAVHARNEITVVVDLRYPDPARVEAARACRQEPGCR